MKNKYITEHERYKLEVYLQMKMSVKDIARELDKCENTIRNEIKRGTVELLDTHLKPYKKYCADAAQRKYEENKIKKGAKPKVYKNVEFIRYIQELILKKKYSPYVISLMLKEFDFGFTLCEKSIYNYIQRGYIPNVTQKNLAYRKKKQLKNKIVVKRVSYNNPTKPLISDRDKSVYLRSDFGHWEMDTVYSGKDKSRSCLLVLTERKFRKEIIIKMPDRTAKSTVNALNDLEKVNGKRNFKKIFKTITCDNGLEFSDYEGITKCKRTKLYYCHPYCSSERGSNENANKLIRRWIPKGEDIGKYSNEDIYFIQEWINNYPRRLFNGLSSNEYMQLAQETM
ncbi:MAG: IS30 family transposase [Lachnospiraceae bacterium]|nr:IS30 family transposase [Lachnospiraceae bacterium]